MEGRCVVQNETEHQLRNKSILYSFEDEENYTEFLRAYGILDRDMARFLWTNDTEKCPDGTKDGNTKR